MDERKVDPLVTTGEIDVGVGRGLRMNLEVGVETVELAQAGAVSLVPIAESVGLAESARACGQREARTHGRIPTTRGAHAPRTAGWRI